MKYFNTNTINIYKLYFMNTEIVLKIIQFTFYINNSMIIRIFCKIGTIINNIYQTVTFCNVLFIFLQKLV